ncbi:transforming growth factor beta regulator 1 [Syngnathoides biaculeatus]|uniref:transforming growth factor beta regulator 1 n=1 Tax=Syngnathoides biaculeatus TaxID=300417 RepID=UPI002ADDA1F2|nr:transforming growth factor beta regulator 1 [Syngnathoides biaculeatus]
MQTFFGLNATGALDRDTLQVMRRPRCGVPDSEKYGGYVRGEPWNKKVITYNTGRYTQNMPRSTVDSLLESALGVWARASGLTFVRSHTRNADIRVDFVTLEHGDASPFDGPGGSLAHAFGPRAGVAADVHFDDDERWTATGTAGFNLLVLAAHEFGHVLGLKHSRNPASLMHPNYKPYHSGANLLSRKDMINIKALYRPHQDRPNNFPWPLSRRIRNRCAPDVTFDAVSTLGDATIFFRDRYLWIKYNNADDIKEGPTSNFMPKIETRIDAAFWVPRRSTAYLIHESIFWMVKGSVVKGKPRALCHFGFPAWVQDIDAAVHIVKTGRTLFFVHDIYWSYNENRRVMDFGYPKYISEDFPGLNSTINAAVHKEAPTIAPTVSPEENELAENYLFQFYNDVGTTNYSRRSLVKSNFTEDLESMQEFFGLEVTGVLNKETVEVMKAPRCGVSDISLYGHFAGKPKWNKRLITYRITQYTPDMSQRQVDDTIGQAFQLYSDVIPLDFKQIYSGTADIMILFKGGYHGDFYPFDGQGGVLAHANSPGRQEGGDTHFDDDEYWTLTQRGVNLLLVAAHEFGHALGLDHSRDRRALMFPTYHYVNTNGYKLPDDDRRGVQALYGSRTQAPTNAPKPNPPPEPEPEDPAEEPEDSLPNPRDERCSRNLVFDAATSIRRDLYFFKNGYYWRKSTMFQGLRFTKVNTVWSQINTVDAAYEVQNKNVFYLFEGNRFWGIRASSKTMLPGYPKLLSSFGLPATVSKIDAAVYLPTTGKVLLFVDKQYWSYDENRNQMDFGYPRPIARDFFGVRSKVDAVFENYGYIYFSSGPKQMEYSPPYRRVNYLFQFYNDVGTRNSSSASLVKSNFSEDLQSMQAFFGLEVTGVLNKETVEVMKAESRWCVSDISLYGHFAGKPKWNKRLITYRITQYTSDMSQRQVDDTIGQAFQLYSDVIPLDFKQIYSGTADIMILFKGGCVNLLLVAAHEFGHALGLDHSRDRRALMFPTYRYVNTNGYKLPDDDRRGVQALYGSRTQGTENFPNPNPPPKPEPEDPAGDPLPNPRDEQCSRSLVLDAAASIWGDLYFFKNGYYWRKSTMFEEIRFTKVSTPLACLRVSKTPTRNILNTVRKSAKLLLWLSTRMESLNTFESEMEADGQGSYSLFPSLDNIAGLSVTADTLESEPPSEIPEKPNLTWLDAAQIVLEESGHPMHIKEIKQRIIDRGLVQSNAKSSLEAVMYRETQKGSKRFKRIENRNGVFALLTDDERQQALKAFAAQAFLGAPQQNSASASAPGGSGAAVAPFPSPASSSENKAKMRRGVRKKMNEKYRVKYLRLRKAARAMIFENAALHDEVAHLEEKFLRAKEERQLLLLHYQSLSECDFFPTPTSTTNPAVSPPATSSAPGGPPALCGTHNLTSAVSAVDEAPLKKTKKERKERGRENGKDELQKKVPKKRKLADGSRKLVQPIPLDSCGRPVFPIVLGGLTVYSLGEIITDRLFFHDECAIYPVGFCSTRVFASMKNPELQCLYTCQIKDGGSGPQFEIVPEDDPQNAIVASSALTCHSNLLKAIASVSSKTVAPIVPSGADFFGFSHPTIQNLIQSCPGARKCNNYRWIRFDVCRAGDGQNPHSLSEDDASVNFEAYQRHRCFSEKPEQISAQKMQCSSASHLSTTSVKPSTSYFSS